MAAGDALSERDRAVLDFERGWWQRADAATKAEVIRGELSLSSASYYAVLSAIVDSPAALAYDPLLVRRLRRRRSERRRARFTGELARHREPR